MRLSDFISKIPRKISENRIDMAIVRVFDREGWHLVYYNPPSGSWKGLSIKYEGYEYRQVGAKRGVKRMKRPDVMLQYEAAPQESPMFLSFETKLTLAAWNKELPKLLEAYFEDPTDGIRRLPFDHRRRLAQAGPWEYLSEGNPGRLWFQKVQPTYLFGFAYRCENPEALASEEKQIDTVLEESVSPPPLVIVAITFEEPSMRLRYAKKYSRTFPREVREEIDKLFDEAAKLE